MLNAYQVNLEVTINDMTETMIETIKKNMLQHFNQLREDDSIHEPNFSLGSPIPNLVLRIILSILCLVRPML